MTAKEYVIKKMPNAIAEKYTHGKGCWVIKNGTNHYFAIGNSETNAWVNAKKKFHEKIKPIQNFK